MGSAGVEGVQDFEEVVVGDFEGAWTKGIFGRIWEVKFGLFFHPNFTSDFVPEFLSAFLPPACCACCTAIS
jgi:hypothetical protein